ncbi:MAG TPA: hypothetical protein VH062_01200 [Polyangiaceae bacterium]|nr:hypothetical protein [Polyangiaceae bacterium]
MIAPALPPEEHSGSAQLSEPPVEQPNVGKPAPSMLATVNPLPNSNAIFVFTARFLSL